MPGAAAGGRPGAGCVGNGLEAPRSVFVMPPVPPFPRRLAAAVVSSLGVGFGSPRAVCGELLRCRRGALVAPVGQRRRPGAGWGSAAPGAWALSLWVLVCSGFGVGVGRGHVFRGWGGSYSCCNQPHRDQYGHAKGLDSLFFPPPMKVPF